MLSSDSSLYKLFIYVCITALLGLLLCFYQDLQFEKFVYLHVSFELGVVMIIIFAFLFEVTVIY